MQPNPDVERLLAELLPNPDHVWAAAKIFKQGTRTHAGQIVLSGKRYFFKRYNIFGPWYRLRYLFKPSRAQKTWLTSWFFWVMQLPVPEPLICLEERPYGLLRRSYLLMELLEGAEKLSCLWSGLSREDKLLVLVKFSEILGRMHRQGCTHGDLKWDNILLRWAGKEPELVLVDLDGGSVSAWNLKRRARNDINRFRRDLQRYEPDPVLQGRFPVADQKWMS